MYVYKATVLRVIDGDTYDVQIDLGFHLTIQKRVRLLGIDTPETYRPKCPAERIHGHLATDFAKAILEGKQVKLISKGKSGKYGRYLATIEVEGLDFGELLTENNLIKWPAEKYLAIKDVSIFENDRLVNE